MEPYGVVSKRAGGEGDLRKSPEMADGYCFPSGMFFLRPVKLNLGLPHGRLSTQQSHSRPQQLLLRHSRTHLRKCLMSSDLTLSPPPVGTRGPLPSPSPALLPLGVTRPRVSSYTTYFPFVPTILSDASRRVSQEQSSRVGICRTCEARGLLPFIVSFGRWLW